MTEQTGIRCVTRNFAQGFVFTDALEAIRQFHALPGAVDDSRVSYAFERIIEGSYMVRVQMNHGAKLHSTLGYLRLAPL